MSYENIPCLKNKCLKFPVCKGKKQICCDILFDYADKEMQYNYIQFWNYVKTLLPNIETVQHPKLPYSLGVMFNLESKKFEQIIYLTNNNNHSIVSLYGNKYKYKTKRLKNNNGNIIYEL